MSINLGSLLSRVERARDVLSGACALIEFATPPDEAGRTAILEAHAELDNVWADLETLQAAELETERARRAHMLAQAAITAATVVSR
jgi:hypothetical protein